MRKRRQTLESPYGVGDVVGDDGKPLSRVRYRLTVFQEILITRTLGGNVSEHSGLKDIRGSLSVVDGERNLTVRDRLSLILQDGRQLDFFATDGGPHTSHYSIVGNGDFRIA